MTIDHIGFHINNDYMRMIGRMAFPIFAYVMVQNLKLGANRENYLKRLLFFGILSTPIYHLNFGYESLNIFFTLALGIVTITLIEQKNYLAILALSISFMVDYGILGQIFIISLYFYPWIASIFSFLMNGLYGIFSFLTTLVLINLKIERGKRVLPSWFFYIYYPIHLIFLYLLFK
jgi:hypothetical protein